MAWQQDTLAQPGLWELWVPCPARRAVLLLRLPTLEFSFAPVIKTNGVNPAAGTGLQGGNGRGWQRGRGGNRDPLNNLCCGTVALQEILGLFLFLQCSALPNPRSPHPHCPLAGSELHHEPGASSGVSQGALCPPSVPGHGAALRAWPMAAMAMMTLRRLHRALMVLPRLPGGLMPTGDLFSCQWAC